MQPVFHTYDIWRYWARVPFVIQYGKSLRTKYTDPKQVLTKQYLDLSEIECKQMADLLQCHYILSDRVLTLSDTDTINSYLTGHSHPAFVSLYQESYYDIISSIHDASMMQQDVAAPSPVSINIVKNTSAPVGCMTSRPVRLFIWTGGGGASQKTAIHAYFWDHICVHRDYTDKHLSRYVIQTHENVQRMENPDISVSLFRKEQILCQGIVPLVRFSLYTFYLNNVRTPPLPPHFTVVRIFGENVDILSDFLYNISTIDQNSPPKFKVCAFPEIGPIIALVKARLYYVYALKRENTVYGIYFLKDSKTHYEDVENGNLLECVGSVSQMSKTNEYDGLFFAGFLHALRKIIGLGTDVVNPNVSAMQKQNQKYRLITFADLSHNGRLLERWRWKYSPVFENPAAYYIYNMVVPSMPLAKEECFILL